VLAALLGLVLCLLLGCDSTVEHARARLFDLAAGDPVQATFAEAARLHVVYWPASGLCRPSETAVIEELRTLEAKLGDIRFVSVVPEGADHDRYGLALPGRVVELGRRSYVRQVALGPLPRIEIWTAGGRNLLLRSIPDYGEQATAVAAEIVASRALTRPLDEMIAIQRSRK